MAQPNSRYSEAEEAFHAWRVSPEAQLPGTGGLAFDTPCRYVPLSKLQEYFARPRQVENLLDAVLRLHERPAVDADYVREHYLQSFAILLSIGQGPLIHHFQQHKSLRDDKLPFRVRPDSFPCIAPDIFDAFKEAQCQFCASRLEHNMNERFKKEDILPITYKEKIGEGGSAIVYKIVVDEDYNFLRPREHVVPNTYRRHQNTFVLKTYRDAEAKGTYEAERDAYMKLRWNGEQSPNIITYYGGFIHGESYNIILEYADQGTLEKFMKTTVPPSIIEDTVLFWDRLLRVLRGLMLIHGSASQTLNGWHQDIKPANILVFGGNTTSPYDCHFKIADLGLTHFKPSVSQLDDPSDLDSFGTRAYGAPETFRSHIDSESSPLQVTTKVDIWSIGCVLSEASVWACHGWSRLSEYRRQRSLEIKAKGGKKGEHLFHYDGKVLDVVNSTHEDIKRKPRAQDYVTGLILDGIVNDILLLKDRPAATFLFEKSMLCIEKAEKKFDVSVDRHGQSSNGELVNSDEARSRTESPPHNHRHSRAKREPLREQPSPPDSNLTASSSSASQSSTHRHHRKSESQSSRPHSTGPAASPRSDGLVLPDPINPPSPAVNAPERSPGQHVQSPQEEPVRPTLSIDQGEEWKRKKKNRASASLHGEENLTYLDQRDHIFLIDNSASMKQYSKEIRRVISLLAYMLKNSDKDGLDIYFTQSVKKVNSRKSSKLSTSIDQEPFRGITDMRGRLQNLFQEHINKFGTLIQSPKSMFGPQPAPQPQRPLSFYILTDGKWQPTDVGSFIKKDLVPSMIAKGRPKEHVAIQFIRFGNDQASINKLDELDHGLGLKAQGMDIVDHTYWNDNVWKQLLGALNDWYDDDPT